jgi:hypothetical protein
MTTPSGPGAFSQRTDKAVGNANASLPNAQYGENRDYQDIKAGAPMATGDMQATPINLQQLFAGMGQSTIPMNAESQLPNVPVTDGAAAGAGAGPEALGLSSPPPNQDAIKAALFAAEWMANRPGSSDSARNLIRKLKAQLGE